MANGKRCIHAKTKQVLGKEDKHGARIEQVCVKCGGWVGFTYSENQKEIQALKDADFIAKRTAMTFFGDEIETLNGERQ